VHDITFKLRQLVSRHRQGSFQTIADRLDQVTLIGNQLHELGFKKMDPGDLKGRHVNRLLALWREQGISTATQKNRMATLRAVARMTGHPAAIAPKNSTYGIGNRTYVATTHKGRELTPDLLDRITDPHVRGSLELQRTFGIRRETALKIRVNEAVQGDNLVLKGSWLKGGKAQVLRIDTPGKREVLARVQALVGPSTAASLIPPTRTYVQQVRLYERECQRVGLSKAHGLRVQYALDEYARLCGWKAPVDGGPHQADLSPEQRAIDQDARCLLAELLNHGREAILSQYIGV
jgi:hypothetical protein